MEVTQISWLSRRSSSFFQNTVLLVGGTGFSQAIVAGTAPILTRIYTPKDFGAYAIVLAIVNFLAVVACARYDVALGLARNDREGINLAILSVTIGLALSVLTAVLVLIALALPGKALQGNASVSLALLVPLNVAVLAFQQVGQRWLFRKHLFVAMTAMPIVQAIVMVGVQITGAMLYGSNAFTLASGSLAGWVASLLLIAPLLARDASAELFAAVSLKRLVAVLKRHRRFPLFTAPYSLVSQLSQRGPIFLLAAFGSAAAIGAFAIAQRTIYLPITVLVAALSQAFFRRAAGNPHGRDVQDIIRRVLIAAAIIFGPLFAATALDMPAIFAFVFGEQWRDAGVYGAWLSIAAMMMLLTYWLDRVYDILGRQRLALFLETGFNITCLSIFAVVLLLTHDVRLAVISFSVVSGVYGFLYLAVTLTIARLETRVLVESLLAILGALAYGASIHLVARVLGHGISYDVLTGALLVPSVVLGGMIAVGKVRLPSMGRSQPQAAGPERVGS